MNLKVVFCKAASLEVCDDGALEEASVYLSVLPIRLNMDQDTVLFLHDFARNLSALSNCKDLRLLVHSKVV